MLDRCLATQASYDVVVVGGGIVGLGTARELIIRHPTLKFAVVEKENELCEYKDSHLLLLGLFLHEGSVAYSLKFGCNDTLKGNSSNNNHNHNHEIGRYFIINTIAAIGWITGYLQILMITRRK